MATKKEMPTAVKPEEERIEPITIYDKNGNFKYLLEFDRNTVEFAESRFGLKPQVLEGALGSIEIRALFFCSFRKHHPKISKSETDKIIEEIGKITPKMLARLVQLFEYPYTELLTDDVDDADEEEKEEREKNSTLTVKF